MSLNCNNRRNRATVTRHSVEVSTTGSYLHIQPSTLESLTRSAANANANRHRNKSKNSVSPRAIQVTRDNLSLCTSIVICSVTNWTLIYYNVILSTELAWSLCIAKLATFAPKSIFKFQISFILT